IGTMGYLYARMEDGHFNGVPVPVIEPGEQFSGFGALHVFHAHPRKNRALMEAGYRDAKRVMAARRRLEARARSAREGPTTGELAQVTAAASEGAAGGGGKGVAPPGGQAPPPRGRGPATRRRGASRPPRRGRCPETRPGERFSGNPAERLPGWAGGPRTASRLPRCRGR